MLYIDGERIQYMIATQKSENECLDVVSMEESMIEATHFLGPLLCL